MEVPQHVIQKWQAVWRKLLDMAYHGKDVTRQFLTDNTHYDDLYIWSKHARNFEQIQFISTWRKYDIKDSDGNYIDPIQVPQLEHLYVPRILFDCLGIDTFMSECFPKCVVTYWEDDSPV
jgi:hypothetical protein